MVAIVESRPAGEIPHRGLSIDFLSSQGPKASPRYGPLAKKPGLGHFRGGEFNVIIHLHVSPTTTTTSSSP